MRGKASGGNLFNFNFMLKALLYTRKYTIKYREIEPPTQ